MELIPVITLALVAVLLVLVIILLARKPVQPPKTTDSGAISALGALVTQNLREGREAQDSRLAAMDRSVSGQLDRFEKRLHGFSVETSQQLDGIRAAVDGGAEDVPAVLLQNGAERARHPQAPRHDSRGAGHCAGGLPDPNYYAK